VPEEHPPLPLLTDLLLGSDASGTSDFIELSLLTAREGYLDLRVLSELFNLLRLPEGGEPDLPYGSSL
jgi:hypothetical protein